MNRAPAEWRQQFVHPRCGGQVLVLDFMLARMDHSGRVRGYSKAAIGRASGVHERQARNQISALESEGAIESAAVFAPQQMANEYVPLVPWVVAARERARAAERFEALCPRVALSTSESPADAGALATLDMSPDPPPEELPPRQRTSTLDTAATANYWRELNKTRW